MDEASIVEPNNTPGTNLDQDNDALSSLLLLSKVQDNLSENVIDMSDKFLTILLIFSDLFILIEFMYLILLRNKLISYLLYNAANLTYESFRCLLII